MTVLPAVVPPLPTEIVWKRDLAPAVAFQWLAAGWNDFRRRPAPSIVYGLLVFVVSLAVVYSLFALEFDFILFPALAGFMVVGPVLAVGLYEKSRRIALGEPVGLADMVFVKPASHGQLLFTGVLLCLLMLVWMRAAVIIYALFFGVVAFPGIGHIAEMLFTTTQGLGMLVTGTVVGALFAGFSFAISVFAVPMLLEKNVDALTAMGSSLAYFWNNRPLMLTWGAIVLGLFLLCLATGLVGLIVAFPVVGHGTWHAYRAVVK